MGRYEESRTDISDLLRSSASGMVKLPDGSIVIPDHGRQLVSKDNGGTWEYVSQPWMEELLQTVYLSDLKIANDGTVAVGFMASEEDTPQYELVSPDGSRIPVDTSGKDIRSIWLSDRSELFLVSGADNEVYRVDGENGRPELFLETEDPVKYLNFYQNNMMVVTDKTLRLYDMEKKEWTEDIALDQFIRGNVRIDTDYFWDSTTLFPFQTEAGILYFAFDGGLYRHVIGGSTMEEIIDGGMSTFGDPSQSIVGMMALNDNEFLALFTGNGRTVGQISHFTYNTDIPTAPEQSLRVYSLIKDPLLEMAIVNYQAEHPEVYVEYDIGIGVDFSVAWDDALKNLNTEILAGNGPDLMLMDGLPVRSYMEKGILADITPWVEEVEQTEELIEPVRNTWQRSGKLYAIPAQFGIPVLTGEKRYLEKITDLKTLADTMEEIRETTPEGNLLDLYAADQTIWMLGQASSPGWQKEDGKIDTVAIAEFLTQAKRIYDCEMAGITEEKIKLFHDRKIGYTNNAGEFLAKNDIYIMPSVAGVTLAAGESKMTVSLLSNAEQLSYLTSGMEMAGDAVMDFKPMPGQAENVYIPISIAGISATSPNQEQAGELLKIILGRENMTFAYESPINLAALEDGMKNVFSEDRKTDWIGISDNGVGHHTKLEIYWSEDKWIDQFIAMCQDVRTPDLSDVEVTDVVIGIGITVLEGEKTVDEAVKEIEQKLAIYLAE